MSDGPITRLRFSLGRFFLWVALVGIWLGVLISGKNDSIHGQPWFATVFVVTLSGLLVIGQYIDRRVLAQPRQHQIEWALLLVGVGILMAPLIHRVLFSA